MNDLYKNIKFKREQLKMSQEELAKKVGYTSRTSIAKIEAGAVDLPQSKIKLFADALDTTPGDLLGNGNLTDVSQNILNDLLFDSEMLELTQKIIQLPTEDKDAIKYLVDFLYKKTGR